MLNINVCTDKVDKIVQQVDALAFFLEQDADFAQELGEISSSFAVPVKAIAKKRSFTGKKGQVVSFASYQEGVVDLVLAGLGPVGKDGLSVEEYRRAIGRVIRTLEPKKCKSVAFFLPQAKLFNISDRELAKQTAIAGQMAAYHFDTFITDQDRKKMPMIVSFIGCNHDEKQLQEGLEEGLIIGEAVNTTRQWIDLPPDHLTPVALAQKAHEIARKNKLKYTVFDEDEIIQMGMGGLRAVSQGSDRNCQLVIMQYDCGIQGAPTIALVGKGITFDSGGLSLKPPAYMETMKEDMSGASAVINTMGALAQLKPKVNVVGLTPLSENLPSGKAIKPGDIITFYNGKTAEVKNTDAEGRLVLADALAYAVEQYKPVAMLDAATLTGACAYALGPYYSGMMSQHDELADQVYAASLRSGDAVWRLPLPDDYNKAIATPVADIANIGSKRYLAGAITAGLFLKNFVGDTPWVHLDIAGTAFNVPDIPYYRPESATGAAVRLFIDFVMNW